MPRRLPLRGHFSAARSPWSSGRPSRQPQSVAAEVLEDRVLLTIYTVNTLSDDPSAGAGVTDGKVSLREAIQAGNTNGVFGDAAAGQGGGVIDAIFFDNLLINATITLDGARLEILDHLSIFGHGANRLKIDGNLASGVFFISGPGATLANVFISGLTVARAQTPAGVQGAGIDNTFGSLQLLDVAVTGCVCVNGGIANRATLRATNVLVSGNVTSGPIGRGGGIYNTGDLRLSNCTISGNRATLDGGGIYSENGPTTLRNVTIFGNRADSDGNDTGTGGGFYAPSALPLPVLENTLVAGNVRGAPLTDVRDDISGNVNGINDVVAHAGSAGGLVHGTGGNIVGTDIATLIDPVLRDNGGSLRTHKLLARSVAINAGSNDSAVFPNGGALTTDGRGFPFARVRGSDVDIGSFESAPAADLVGFLAGQWRVGASTGTSFTSSTWTNWANVGWDALGQADFNNDGRTDVYGLLDGSWWVALSTGTAYAAPSRWAGWSNVDWRDVKTADLNGDGRADVLARLGGGQWWAALSNGTAFNAPTIWASWSSLDWREFFTPDLDGDNRADLLGFAHGQWWAGISSSSVFDAPKLLAAWSDVAWQKLLILDADGDGEEDVAGLLGGSWWVGISDGGADFATSRWAAWSNVAWSDPLTGDFDGDGTGDIAARNGGSWWVALSTETVFAAPKLWAGWSNVLWKDVRVADFDGDSREDIAGRFNGQWWVARSLGAAFATTLWGSWSEAAWRGVGAVDATGHVPAPSGPGAAFSASQSSQTSAVALRVADEEPLRLFWLRSEQDEEFTGRLLAG